jgi:hypothetical protein
MSPQPGGGTISGTLLDANRDVLQGARLTLSGPSGFPIRSVESGNNGQFALTGLPPDVYTLTVTAPGMNTLRLSRYFLYPTKARNRFKNE